MQSNEGNIDPVHLSYLHRSFENREERYRGVRGASESHYNLVAQKLAPLIDVELVDFGVRIYTVRKLENDKILFAGLVFHHAQLQRVSRADRRRGVLDQLACADRRHASLEVYVRLQPQARR